MADNKSSFLLYCDIIHTVKKLSDEQAGILFKHILSYVNDEHPVTEDVIIELVFEPIKQSLKRDLQKYERICERNKVNGGKGGRPIKPKKPNGLIGNPKNPDEPKKPDSDIVSDSESDIDREIRIKKELEEKKQELEKKRLAAIASTAERKKDFYNSLVPYAKTYSRETMRNFYEYWTEPNKSGFKMRFELEKTWLLSSRLGTWARREKTISSTKPQTKPIINTPEEWKK